MPKFVVFYLCTVLACIAGQRITTIQLEGAQYFISRMNPYSPELNYFLAYQYCRSLGLQLASFETQEKVDSMTTYLTNAGYSSYDFWTSGNRLGTGMHLWMSTGIPFNASFNFFENSLESIHPEILEPIDHNSNTAPQRTARDSSSGLDKGCVILKAPSLRWSFEDCSTVKDFICEQTRCYYYNYGSIPVSSAQGRPIISKTSTTSTTTTTTTRRPQFSSTSLPHILLSSTYPTYIKNQEKRKQMEIPKSTASSKDELSTHENPLLKHNYDLHNYENDDDIENEEPRTLEETDVEETESDQRLFDENLNNDDNQENEEPTVEERLKQISHEIEKYGSSETNDGDLGRQSFFSLSDLIKTLRPNDKKIPQIDSDYSNTMRVLGESSSVLGSDESKKI